MFIHSYPPTGSNVGIYIYIYIHNIQVKRTKPGSRGGVPHVYIYIYVCICIYLYIHIHTHLGECSGALARISRRPLAAFGGGRQGGGAQAPRGRAVSCGWAKRKKWRWWSKNRLTPKWLALANGNMENLRFPTLVSYPSVDHGVLGCLSEIISLEFFFLLPCVSCGLLGCSFSELAKHGMSKQQACWFAKETHMS